MISFSIIVPIYNVEDYIEECIQSILVQDYQEFEIICVDDGSTDSSIELVSNIKSEKIRIIVQENQGLSSARNTGLANATKEFIWFIDSDDFISGDALNKLAQGLSNEKLEVLGFNYLQYCDGEFSSHLKLTEIDSMVTGSQYIEYSEFFLPMAWTYVYERKFLEKHNCKFKIGIYHEDDYFNLSLFGKVSRIKNITDVLYYYRIRPASITSSNNLIVYKKRIFSYFQLIKLVRNTRDLSKEYLVKKEKAYIRNIFVLLNSQIKTNENVLQLYSLVKQIKLWMKDASVSYPSTDKFSLLRKIIFINTCLYVKILRRFKI